MIDSRYEMSSAKRSIFVLSEAAQAQKQKYGIDIS